MLREFKVVGPNSGSSDGIYFHWVDWSHLEKTWISAFGSDGTNFDDCDYCSITDNKMNGNGSTGVRLNTFATNTVIQGNHCYDNAEYGIWIYSSYHTSCVNNVCDYNGIGGIYARTSDHEIVGNDCNYNVDYGIRANTYVSSIVGNVCARNGYPNGGYGIWVSGAQGNNVITGNQLNHQYADPIDAAGILIEGSPANVVVGNNIWEHPPPASGGNGDGIRVEDDSDDTIIVGNTCNDNTRYGINISTANCNDTVVKDNKLIANATAHFNDAGTDTVMHILHIPFLEPIGTAAWDVSPPSGIEVDAVDEGAFTMGTIPNQCQQTMRIKVWAVGLATPGAGNQMEMTFNMDAGQPDEAYNAEVIAVANKISDQTNFAVNDIVTWTLTPTDDSDIGDLAAEDCFEIRVMFDAGGAPDIDTDALFRCVEIHYV